jgi:hypothetical protein
VQLQFNWTLGRNFPRFERQNQLEALFVFRPLPQLDGSFDLAYTENAGTIRQIRTAGPVPEEGDPTATFARTGATDRDHRLYILAPQQARGVSATLRGTYAFTPYLTLQAYAQLFTAGISYGDPLRAQVDQRGRPTVRLDDLRPARGADKPPVKDERDVGLNVNLILRWEWRTGSTLYLVYAHQSSSSVTLPARSRLDYGAELALLNSSGIAHGDTVLVKVDLLSAL